MDGDEWGDACDCDIDRDEIPCYTRPGPSLWDCAPGQSCCESADNVFCKYGHYCLDDTANFFIRVYRKSGTAKTCKETEYVLEVSNG